MSAGVADRSNVLHFWQCHEPIVSSFIATGTRFSSYSILRACRTRANLAMHTEPIWNRLIGADTIGKLGLCWRRVVATNPDFRADRARGSPWP